MTACFDPLSGKIFSIDFGYMADVGSDDDIYDVAAGPDDFVIRNEAGMAGEGWIDIEAISTEMVDPAWGKCAFQEDDLEDYFAAEAADRAFWRDIWLSFSDWDLDDQEVGETQEVGQITINGTVMSADMLDKFDGDDPDEDEWDEWPDEDDHRAREYEHLPMGCIGSQKIYMIRLSKETCEKCYDRAPQPQDKGRKHPHNVVAIGIHLSRRNNRFADLGEDPWEGYEPTPEEQATYA